MLKFVTVIIKQNDYSIFCLKLKDLDNKKLLTRCNNSLCFRGLWREIKGLFCASLHLKDIVYIFIEIKKDIAPMVQYLFFRVIY
jgi:hypothetical protein